MQGIWLILTDQDEIWYSIKAILTDQDENSDWSEWNMTQY